MIFRIAVALAGVACAQSSFEVASIKPSNSEDRRVSLRYESGGRFWAANVTVRKLMQEAYGVKDFQIVGGPSWIGSDFFDINAKPEDATKMDEVPVMIRALLAERFRLVKHRETKEMPVYALSVAKNGSKLKGADEAGQSMIRVRRGLLVAPKGEMKTLAELLSSFLGRTLIDRTGLTGAYDIKLEWVPDENQVAMFSGMGVPEGF